MAQFAETFGISDKNDFGRFQEWLFRSYNEYISKSRKTFGIEKWSTLTKSAGAILLERRSTTGLSSMSIFNGNGSVKAKKDLLLLIPLPI